jgi:hypothetical protein
LGKHARRGTIRSIVSHSEPWPSGLLWLTWMSLCMLVGGTSSSVTI